MKALNLVGALLGAALVPMACNSDNSCETALKEVRAATTQVCAEDGFKTSSFCTICADAGFLSTTGALDCKCKLLAFDESYCTYPTASDTKASVRGAIAWANQNCATFTFGVADSGAGGETFGGGAAPDGPTAEARDAAAE
jgi:hypothetical protein